MLGTVRVMRRCIALGLLTGTASFKMLGTTCTGTQHHTSEGFNCRSHAVRVSLFVKSSLCLPCGGGHISFVTQ